MYKAMTPPVPHVFEKGVEKKRCYKCSTYKSLDDFNKASKAFDGFQQKCRACIRDYYVQNQEREQQYAIDYRKTQLDRLEKDRKRRENMTEIQKKRLRESQRRYNKRNRAKAAAYQRNRRQTDEDYRILTCLRSRLRSAAGSQGAVKADTTNALCGCTPEELRAHLESTMPLLGDQVMSFEEHSGLQIDHYLPCSAFNLLDPLEQRICFHYTNLQVLTDDDNWEKRDKLPCSRQEFEGYVSKRKEELKRHDAFISL